MQTFLPIADMNQSIACLDNKRLISQRKEAKQIIDRLTGNTAHWKNPEAWKNHPAVRMWKGYRNALGHYYNLCIIECKLRGIKNTMIPYTEIEYDLPPWFGDKTFHDAHKSKLLSKDPKHYGKFGWDVPFGLTYWWPVQ